MAGMINCMRFRPKVGQADDLFKAYAEYVRDYPFDDIMHKIIDLGDGELALIGICLLYTSPSPRDATLSRMPSSA